MSSTIFFLHVLVLHILVFVYQVDSLPKSNNHILKGATYLGDGELQGPYDIAYDKKSEIIYTGCADGFIKKVYIGKSKTSHTTKVENWVNTGGRPLGVALGRHNELIVGDAYKGLLSVSKYGVMKRLTNEAEGLPFNLTNGVDVADNGMIYFTDSTYKYGLADFVLDDGSKPYGRFMSFDPVTRKTKVLVRDIYFANGVVVSPDQNYVIFCEAKRFRCRKYHIRGSKMGLTENYIDNLPSNPVNIRYDGQGHYWIGIFKDFATSPDGGIVATNLEGKIIAYYSDFNLSLTGGNKIGDKLYCGSLIYPHILVFDRTQP